MLCMKLETQEIKLTVGDIIDSGKRGAANFLTAVQHTGDKLAERAEKLQKKDSGIAKSKKKKKKRQTVGSSISHNSMVIQRSAASQ